MRKLLFCILLFPLLGTSQEYGIQFSKLSFEEVQAEALAQDKLIFVDGYTDWCEPCKVMDIGVFTSQRVGIEYNKNFISYKMNMEKGMGPIMAVRYSVGVIPTFLFLTSDGTMVYSISGYQGEDELISAAQVAMSPGRKELAWDARYADGDRKGDFLFNYTMHKYQEQDPLYRSLVNEYLETQKDWGSRSNVRFIYTFMESVDSPMFDYMAQNRTQFFELYGEEKINKTIDLLVNNKIYNSNPPLQLSEIGDVLIKAYPEDGAKRFLNLKLDRFLKEKRHDEYAAAVIEYNEMFPSNNAEDLIGFAKYFNQHINDKATLQKALSWVEKGIASDQSIENYKLLASLCSKTGDRKRAI
ncbi:MAG: thioredoxin family protein, partial [Bacteroidota bacterium]